MTLKSLIKYGLALAVVCIAAFAMQNKQTQTSPLSKKTTKQDNTPDVLIQRPFSIEAKKEVVTAIKPDLDPVEKQEQLFTFDWNQQATISESKKKISEEEIFISKITDVSKLSKEDQLALGKLFYKLGTYYTHVAREPDLAITKLMMANTLLNDKQDKAWNYNHLAYAYEQKYALANNSADKEKALYYANKVISELLPNTKDKPIAFAYSMKGLIQNNAKEYIQAEKNFKTALTIYEAIPNSKDDQYARTKNRLANALLGQNGREKEAITLIKRVKNYWSAKGNISQDPYAARCMLSLGQAYLQTGQAKSACSEFKTAIAIYQNLYGTESPLLVKPYQLLAQAYKKLGKLDQASAYEKKADAIDRA